MLSGDYMQRMDEIAGRMRAAFEAHRPLWWQFWRRDWNADPGLIADDLMLELLVIVESAFQEPHL